MLAACHGRCDGRRLIRVNKGLGSLHARAWNQCSNKRPELRNKIITKLKQRALSSETETHNTQLYFSASFRPVHVLLA